MDSPEKNSITGPELKTLISVNPLVQKECNGLNKHMITEEANVYSEKLPHNLLNKTSIDLDGPSKVNNIIIQDDKNISSKPEVVVKKKFTYVSAENKTYRKPIKPLLSGFTAKVTYPGIARPAISVSYKLGNGKSAKICKKLLVETDIKTKEYYYSFPVNQHVLIKEDGEKCFKCHICEKMYLHAFSLKRHFLRNHVSKEYISEADKSNCKIASSKKIKLSKNKDPSVGRKKKEMKGVFLDNNDDCQMPGLFQCSYHNVKYDLDSELRNHYVTVFHSKSEELTCKNCDEAFETKRKLNDHLKNCCNPVNKSNHCKKCNIVFKSYSECKAHLAKHRTGVECKYCNKEFSNPANRKRHENLHEGNAFFICKHCDSSFLGKKELNNHTRKIHMDLYFTCDLCPKQGIAKMYATENILLVHMKERHGIKTETLIKNITNSKMNSPSKLVLSKKLQANTTSHSSDVELIVSGVSQSTSSVCNLCRKIFPDVRTMLRHKNIAHKKRTTYKRKVKKTIKMKTFRKKPSKKEEEEELKKFYRRLAQNIAENLLYHIDGTESQLSLSAHSKILPTVISESELSKFNFSDKFKGSGSPKKSSLNEEDEESDLKNSSNIFAATGLNKNQSSIINNNQSSTINNNQSSITCFCHACRALPGQSISLQDRKESIGVTKIKYLCSVCKKQFNSRADFNDHCSNNHPFIDEESILLEIEGNKDNALINPEYFLQSRQINFFGVLSERTPLISVEIESSNFLKCTKCQIKVSKEYLHDHMLKCGGNELISNHSQPRKRTLQKRIKRTMKHRIDLSIRQKPTGECESNRTLKNSKTYKNKPGKDYFNVKNRRTIKHFSMKESTPPCSACKKTFSSQALLKNHLCTPVKSKRGRKPKVIPLQTSTSFDATIKDSVNCTEIKELVKEKSDNSPKVSNSCTSADNVYSCDAAIDLSVKNNDKGLCSKLNKTNMVVFVENTKSYIDALKETVARITGIENEKERVVKSLESNGQSAKLIPEIIHSEKNLADKTIGYSKAHISNNNNSQLKKSKKSLDEALKKITKSNSQIGDIGKIIKNRDDESQNHNLEINSEDSKKLKVHSENASPIKNSSTVMSLDQCDLVQTNLQLKDGNCNSFADTSKQTSQSTNLKSVEEHNSMLSKSEGQDLEDITPSISKRSRKKTTPSKIILNSVEEKINTQKITDKSLKAVINSKMKDISQNSSKQLDVSKTDTNDNILIGINTCDNKLQTIVQNPITSNGNVAEKLTKPICDLTSNIVNDETPTSYVQVQADCLKISDNPKISNDESKNSILPIKIVESLSESLPALQAPVLFLSNECQNSELASSQDRDSPTLEVLVSSVTQNLEEFDEHSCLDDDKFPIPDPNQNNIKEKQDSLKSSLNFTIIIPESKKVNPSNECLPSFKKNFSSDFPVSSDFLKLDKNFLSASQIHSKEAIEDISVKIDGTKDKSDPHMDMCKNQFISLPTNSSCNKVQDFTADANLLPITTASEKSIEIQNTPSITDKNELYPKVKDKEDSIILDTVNSILADKKENTNISLNKMNKESLDCDVSNEFVNEKLRPSALKFAESFANNSKSDNNEGSESEFCQGGSKNHENILNESSNHIPKNKDVNIKKCVQNQHLLNQEKIKSSDNKKAKSPIRKGKKRLSGYKKSTDSFTSGQIEINNSAVSHLRAYRRSQSEILVDGSETNSTLSKISALNNTEKENSIKKVDCQKDNDKSSLITSTIEGSGNETVDLHLPYSNDSLDKEQILSHKLEVTPSHESLETVVIKKETDGAKKHACPYCRLEFAYLTNFRRHMKQCRGNSELRPNEQPSSSTPHLLHHLPKKEEVAESMLNLYRHQIRQNQMKQEVEKSDTESNKDNVSNEPKKLQTYTCPFCHKIFLKLFEQVKHLTNVHLLSNEESKVYLHNQNCTEQRNIEETNTHPIKEDTVHNSNLSSNSELINKCSEQKSVAVIVEEKHSNSTGSCNSSDSTSSLNENCTLSSTKTKEELNRENPLSNVIEKKGLLKNKKKLTQSITETDKVETLHGNAKELSENNKTKGSSKNQIEALSKTQFKTKGNLKSNIQTSEVNTNSYPSRNKEIVSKRKNEFLDTSLCQLPSYGQGRGRKKTKVTNDSVSESNKNVPAVETSKEISSDNTQIIEKESSKLLTDPCNTDALNVDSKTIVNKLKDSISNKMKLLASKSINVQNNLQSSSNSGVIEEKSECKEKEKIQSISVSSANEVKNVKKECLPKNGESTPVQSSVDEKKDTSSHNLSPPKRGRKRKSLDITSLKDHSNILNKKTKEVTKENEKSSLSSKGIECKTSVSHNKIKPAISPRKSKLLIDSPFIESDPTNISLVEKSKTKCSLDNTKMKSRRGPKTQPKTIKTIPVVDSTNSSLPSTSDSVYSQIRQPRKSKRSSHCDNETSMSQIVRRSSIIANHSDSDDFVSSPEKDLIKNKRKKKIASKNVCLICKKKFTTSLERNRHLQLVHKRKNLLNENDILEVESSNDKSPKKETEIIRDRSSFQRQCAKPLPPLKRKYEKQLNKTLKFRKTR